MTSPLISKINSELHLADKFYARTVELSVEDLTALVRLAESADTIERCESAKKHAGWVRPGSLQSMRCGIKGSLQMQKRKTPEFCMEVFFAGSLRDAAAMAEMAKEMV